jgi:hypothetical protein
MSAIFDCIVHKLLALLHRMMPAGSMHAALTFTRSVLCFLGRWTYLRLRYDRD